MLGSEGASVSAIVSVVVIGLLLNHSPTNQVGARLPGHALNFMM